MSAFVLFHNNDTKLIQKSQLAFSQRGFIGGKVFNTSVGTLLLYPKQNTVVSNYYQYNDCSVYAIGTVIYKGLSYTESLKALASDFSNGMLATKNLRGSFVVLFDKNGMVSILTDETKMYRLFSDQQCSFVSSSLIVASALIPSIEVDEDSVVEQILCGYIGGGQTLVKGIEDVSFCKEKITWLNDIAYKQSENTSKQSENERAKAHAQILHKYLQDVKSLSEEYGAECGLSGGCDSRLVFSSVNVDCTPMKSVHTHQTSKIHDNEIKVVKELSALYDVPLTIIPTTYLPYYNGGIDEVLRENVLYFDARNAGNIGAMSQTHTRDYKKQTSGAARVTFSGIGGEIYRNFYFTNLPYVDVEGWLMSRIFEPGTKWLLPARTYKNAVERIKGKIAVRTGLHIGKYSQSVLSKRYFDSYRIPFALGNVVNANNQMSFYLAPFTEKLFIKEAKNDRKYQDHSGCFEGKILCEFDPKAAAITSSRGFPLSNIPQSVAIKWKVMGMLPSFVWRIYEKRHRFNPHQRKAYAALMANSPYYCKALAWFKNMFPDWSYQVVEEGGVSLNNFVFTVCSVYELIHFQPNHMS